jgi:ketosteroid isomerase-like protein
MASGHRLTDIHPAVEAGVNNRDLDGLMALYADDARMVTMDGAIAEDWTRSENSGPEFSPWTGA